VDVGDRIFVDTSLTDVRVRALRLADDVLSRPHASIVCVGVGPVIRVVFADAQMTDTFRPSIEHLVVPCETTTPEFTIVVGDSRTFGPLPQCREDIEGQPRDSATELDEFGAVGVEPGMTISAVDWPRSLGVWWLDEVDGTTNWQVSAPFRQILAWWAIHRGGMLAHAAVVGSEGRGLMLTGVSGSGKSTTAMQAGLDGLQILGDDYCYVAPGVPAVAYSLTRATKVSDESLALLGGHVGTLDNTHRRDTAQKNLVYLPTHGPRAAATALRIVGIVVPTVGQEQIARIEPCPGAAALSSLAMSSIFQFNAPAAEVFARCRQLVASVATHRLELGRELSSATGLLAGLLAEDDSAERASDER